MRFKFGFYLVPLILLFCISCNPDKGSDESGTSWIRPQAGTMIKLGDKLNLQLQVNDSTQVDSIVYFLDGIRKTSGAEKTGNSIETDSLPLGNRLITAKVYRKGKAEEINTNIVLKSNLTPQKFTYKVLQVFDHDTSSYTQGLEYQNGFFYESDGGNTPETGYSSLRRVEPATGKVLQKVDFPQTFFAEGLTLVDDKIILLSWLDNVGLVFDKTSMKQLSEFPYQNSRQGWGLCSDDKRLYKSDGSNLIYFLNRANYREEGYIEVYDHNGPVDQLNELELIDGKIYANIYNSDRIVIINPLNGQITGEIDMSNLLPAIYHYPGTDVLNGIAWDGKGKRLFVTGKKWAKLFHISISPVEVSASRQ